MRKQTSSTTKTDYVRTAVEYAQKVVGDKRGKVHGKWIRLAAKRFLADLRRANRKRGRPFEFSPEWANRYCRFIEKLPHVEGEWDEPTIRLAPSQCFFIVQLFGFRKADGTRRFSTALYAIARKNGKSTLAAAIMLALYCLEPGTGPQLMSAATTGDQARIVWGIARRMVDREVDLREKYQLEAFSNTIPRYDVGGVFRPINAKASTQDGLNPSALAFDELHAHKTRDLFDVLRSAAGARRDPLFLYTTTEGYENPGPWSEVRKFAQNILDGVIEADHFLVVFYAVDDEDDDFDEAAWLKANPLMEQNPQLLRKIREAAIEAKQQPGALAEFRIKRLNRPAAAGEGWIDLLRWKKCGGPVDLEMLKEHPCWGGLDLASTRDMAAWRLVWFVNETIYTWGRYWVPGEAVHHRTERAGINYAGWVAAGHVKMTEGDVIDYRVIRDDIVADCSTFQVQEIGFDPWNATQTVQDLQEEGLKMVEFIQGPKSYHPAMQALESYYIAGKLAHGGNPVLTWNAANIVARKDVNLNMAPDKKRSADKIDGMVALLMAVGMFVRTGGPSVYESRGLIVL